MRPSVFKLSALGCILGGFCLAAIFPSSGNLPGHGGAINIINYADTGGPVATPTPGLPHVADSNARLSLTAEGVVVSGAGTAEVNGLYTQRGTLNSRPYYNLANLPTDTQNSGIVNNGGNWLINGAGRATIYFSGQDVALPSDVTVWSLDGGANPLPTVTHSPGQVTGAGYAVFQEDNSTIYTFLGYGTDADAGLRVMGAGSAPSNDAYGAADDGHGNITYSAINTIAAVIAVDITTWKQVPKYHENSDTTYPWQDAWTADSDGPAPNVYRNPIASLANWTP